jgi:hypothetical protein
MAIKQLNNAALLGIQAAKEAADMRQAEEGCARMSRTDLDARPVFNRVREAIGADLAIVFTALAVARAIQDRTGLAIANVIKQLRPLRSATIAINGTTRTFPHRSPTCCG